LRSGEKPPGIAAEPESYKSWFDMSALAEGEANGTTLRHLTASIVGLNFALIHRRASEVRIQWSLILIGES
jgi:hypothetical protein